MSRRVDSATWWQPSLVFNAKPLTSKHSLAEHCPALQQWKHPFLLRQLLSGGASETAGDALSLELFGEYICPAQSKFCGSDQLVIVKAEASPSGSCDEQSGHLRSQYQRTGSRLLGISHREMCRSSINAIQNGTTVVVVRLLLMWSGISTSALTYLDNWVRHRPPASPTGCSALDL